MNNRTLAQFAKVLLGLLSPVLFAPLAVACDTNPTRMRRELSEASGHALVNRWWDGGKCEALLLDGISSGKSDWLRFAVAVSQYTDAWPSESLAIELGAAMQRAPSRVLPLVGQGRFKLEICYPWDFDDSAEGIRRKRLGLPKAIRMFEGFRATTLSVPAQQCAEDLRSALGRMKLGSDGVELP